MPRAALQRASCLAFVVVLLLNFNSVAAEDEDQVCQRIRQLGPEEDACAYAREFCHGDSQINYTQAYYCHAYPSTALQALLITAYMLFLVLLFRAMAVAADDFFSVVLSQISQEMGLPPRLAGVTLLSLGNGAPDLSASIAAVKTGDYGLALGSLTGGSMFVTCIVAGRIILLCGGVSARGAQLRDIAFFVAAWILIAASTGGGAIGIGTVAGLLTLYFLYVVVVALAALFKRMREGQGPSPVQLIERVLSRRPSTAVMTQHRHHRHHHEGTGAGGLGGPTPALEPVLSDQLEQGLLDLGGKTGSGSSAFAARAALPPSSQGSSGRSETSSAVEMTAVTTNRIPREPPVAAFEPRGSYRDLLEMSVQEYRSAALAAMADSRSYRRGRGESSRQRRSRRRRYWAGPTLRASTLPTLPAFTPSEVSSAALEPAFSDTYVEDVEEEEGSVGGRRPRRRTPSSTTSSSDEGSEPSSPGSTQSLPQLYELSLPGRARSSRGEGVLRSVGFEEHLSAAAPLDRETVSTPAPLERYRVGERADRPEDDLLRKSSPPILRVAVSGEMQTTTQGASGVVSRPSSSLELQPRQTVHASSHLRGPHTVVSRFAVPSPFAPVVKSTSHLATLGRRIWWDTLWPAMQTAVRLADMPIGFALRAAIPLAERGSYSRPWFVIACTLAPLVSCVMLGEHGVASLATAGAIGAAAGLAAVLTTQFAKMPPPTWTLGADWPLGALCLALGGFVVAALLINGIAAELVGLLQFFGVLSGIDAAVLGVTVLAWGNSLADLMTNVSLARRGTHGTSMAMTACFAGPLFNALVGLGIGFAVALHQSAGGKLNVGLPLVAALGVGFALAAALAVMLIAKLHAFHLPSWVGTVLLVWYAAYMVAVVVGALVGRHSS